MSHKHNLLPLIFSVLPMTGYGLGSANALFFDPFASVEETFFQNIDKTAYQLLEEMNQACELSGTPDLSSELENTITERWWDIFNYLPEEERRRLIKLLTALELPHDYFSSVSTEEDIFGEPEHMPDQLVPQPASQPKAQTGIVLVQEAKKDSPPQRARLRITATMAGEVKQVDWIKAAKKEKKRTDALLLANPSHPGFIDALNAWGSEKPVIFISVRGIQSFCQAARTTCRTRPYELLPPDFAGWSSMEGYQKAEVFYWLGTE